MIKLLIKKSYSPFSRLINYSIINQKLYYGQGGQLKINLTKRSYQFQIQTFWEDHCLISIEGLTGVENYKIEENQSIALLSDQNLKTKLDEKIKILMKLPEDFTLNGVLNGNLNHIPGEVESKIRSKPFQLSILGQHSINLANVQTQKLNISNEKGTTSIANLTVKEATIQTNSFSASKAMISQSFNLNANNAFFRSLINFGQSSSLLKASNLYIQSISGKSKIISDKIRIDRYYGGLNDIDIDCKIVDHLISIQSGTGKIKLLDEKVSQMERQKIKLGKRHKGNIEYSSNCVQIR